MIPATNIQLPLETSVIYLQDKPLKIIKKHKSMHKQKSRRIKEKSRKNQAALKKVLKEVNNKIKQEIKMNVNEDIEHINTNDPLFTPKQIKVKCELPEEIKETNEENENVSDSEQEIDKDFSMDGYEKEDEEDEEYEFKDGELIDDEDEGDDDEPLILLTKNRPSTYKKKKKRPRLHNCLETCKYKCVTKFNKQQRLDIFDYYWNLSKEEKLNFIRQHTRKPILAKVRTKKGRNNCCYFLKYYGSNQDDEFQKEENDDDLIKVCRKFFENTVGVSGLEIKDAIEGYELKKEKLKFPAKDIINKNVEKLEKQLPKETSKPQMFLDPETGNLTDTKPKIKTKRRKPGDPLPKRFPKPINCDIRCRFKCHLNFSEEERKKLCDMFWSLDFKRRKDFILARIEKNEVESITTPEFRKSNRPVRSYQTKFFLRASPNGENKRVCKHFIMNTLRINRHFIENAMEFADETTGFYTGTDRRGGATAATIKQSQERKKQIMLHINSYPYWVPNKKSKTKYLHHSLSIRKMYDAYKDKCLAEQQKFVSTCYYYTVFHNDFRLAFLSNPQQKKKVQLSNPNISHYTGEEPGGYWIDSNDKKLELRTFNPSESLNIAKQNSGVIVSELTTESVNSPEENEHTLLNIVNPSTFMPVNQSSSRVVVRSDLNPSLYELFLKGP